MLNTVTLSGNVTADAVLYSPDEPTKQRVQFRIMSPGLTPMGVDDQGITITLFGKAAPWVADRALKGVGVVVSGRLEAEVAIVNGEKVPRYAKLAIEGRDQPLNIPIFRIVASQLGGVVIQNTNRPNGAVSTEQAAEAAADVPDPPF